MLLLNNRMFNDGLYKDGGELMKTSDADSTKVMISVLGYTFDMEAGNPLHEMSQCMYKDQEELVSEVNEARENKTMEYRGIQIQHGVNGGPIIMWNAGGVGAIIGVHSCGDGNFNYGSVFFDDKGLLDLFGADNFKEFMQKCPTYVPRQEYKDILY